MKRKTHEEYVAEILKVNPNIEVVGEYVGAHTKILHRCKIDGYEWYATPANIRRGRGCPKCGGHIQRKHEDYIKQLSSSNPNIEVLGKYINNTTPILHKCTVHNVIWNAIPLNILRGHGCRKCGNDILYNARRKTKDQYIKDLKAINSDISVLGNYVNAQVPILHKCLIDGYEWYAKPNNILNGKGCPKCSGTFKKTHGEYLSELSIINPDIKVIGEYVNSYTPILHRCKIDGYEWYAKPTNILNGGGCPQCSESSGERMVRQWLSDNDIKYVYQKSFDNCKDKYPLSFDFYLPDYNCCIEYQGGQHYFPVEHFGGEEKFELQQKHDNIKREYCKNNNIRLLEIPYFKNVREELNNFLFI